MLHIKVINISATQLIRMTFRRKTSENDTMLSNIELYVILLNHFQQNDSLKNGPRQS